MDFKSLQNRETQVTRQRQVQFACILPFLLVVVEVEVLTLVQKESSLWDRHIFPWKMIIVNSWRFLY